MSTIVTRAGKGSALTHAELDANQTNLNTDKVEKSGSTMTGALTFDTNAQHGTFEVKEVSNGNFGTAGTLTGVTADTTISTTGITLSVSHGITNGQYVTIGSMVGAFVLSAVGGTSATLNRVATASLSGATVQYKQVQDPVMVMGYNHNKVSDAAEPEYVLIHEADYLDTSGYRYAESYLQYTGVTGTVRRPFSAWVNRDLSKVEGVALRTDLFQIRNDADTYNIGSLTNVGTELVAPFITRKPPGVTAGNMQTWINDADVTVASLTNAGILTVAGLSLTIASGIPGSTSSAQWTVGDRSVAGNPLTGTTQIGNFVQFMGKTSATGTIEGLRVDITTDTAAFTTAAMRGIYVVGVGKQGSAVATRANGIFVLSVGSANNKVGIQYGSSTSWTGNWALFIDSTDTSHFAGPIVVGGTTINANAILDLQSTTKPFMPPRMTTTERGAVASPTAGMVIYNTTTNKLNVYTTAWEAVTSA